MREVETRLSPEWISVKVLVSPSRYREGKVLREGGYLTEQ
jgi:hypothetical protein